VPPPALACPFCGLICDDLMPGNGGIDTRGCAKSAAGFARVAGHVEHRIDGRPASLEEAAARAAAILDAARLPLVTGLGVDLAGIRALLALADRVGAVVDPWRSAVSMHGLSVMQRSGAFTASFAEIANRADMILIIGSDPALGYPRFYERLVDNPKPLYRSAAPRLAYLGPAALAPAVARVAEQVHVDPPDLLDAVAALAALAGGRPPRTEEIAGVPAAALGALAEQLKAARYGAVVWDPEAFGDAADLAAETLLHLLRRLNRRTRCVGLPLGGSENMQGLTEATLWQTGWPARVSLARGSPEHDPWRCAATRLAAAAETDALLWVAALSPEPPPVTTVPTLALVAGDVELSAPPAVEIRVGIPGIDHAGAVVRADKVVTLPLTAVRPGGLPSVAAAALAILDRLGRAT
jgi:formylmethanofuran dehydrogenase subunit B